MTPNDETRLLSMLRQAIHLAEKQYRDVAQTLGWSPEKLARILKGTVDLKVWDLVAILGAVGIPPHDFFAVAFPTPPGARPGRLRETLQVLYRVEQEEGASASAQVRDETWEVDELLAALRDRLSKSRDGSDPR